LKSFFLNRRTVCCVLFSGVLALGVLFLLALPELQSGWALARLEAKGDRCFRAGEADCAEEVWREILAADPDRASARNRLVILYLNESRFEEAEKLLQNGIARSPRITSFQYNLGLLYYMQQRHDEALACLDEVLERSPMHSEVHFLKGAIFQQMGREDEARAEFIRELNVDPVTPEAWAEVLDRDMELSKKLLARIQRQYE
jgi:tetratricopeptide (TPR) repeat protein